MTGKHVAVGDMELLEELVLGTRGSGRKSGPQVVVSKVRSLAASDVEALANPAHLGSKPKPLLQIRSAHHQLARLIAAGKPDQEISLITGYAPAYISSLKSGQDFKDLIKYYSEVKEMIFVEAMERMKLFGLTCLDELQRRFEEAPEIFTHNQTAELIELMLVKPLKAQVTSQSAGQGAGAGGVTVNVQFIKSDAPAQIEAPADGVGEILDLVPSVVGAIR